MKSFTGVQSHFVIREISFLSLDHSTVQMGSSAGMCCSEMCVSQAARRSPYLCSATLAQVGRSLPEQQEENKVLWVYYRKGLI